jgi:hypothetical protein
LRIVGWLPSGGSCWRTAREDGVLSPELNIYLRGTFGRETADGMMQNFTTRFAFAGQRIVGAPFGASFSDEPRP